MAALQNCCKHRHILHSPTDDTNFMSNLEQKAEEIFDVYPLVRDTIAASTRAKYLSAFKRFLSKVGSLPPSAYKLDILLRDYMHNEAMENASAGRKQDMANLISHLSIVAPELSRLLPRARRTLKGWQKLTPPTAALPLTLHVLLAVVHYLRCNNQFSVAAALATAWGGYLRASEVLKLNWEDISLKGDVRTKHLAESIVGVNVKDAKTGPLQFTAIREPLVLSLIHRYAETCSRTGRAFPISYCTYLAKLKAAASFFGLSGKLTPHSARIGGALHDYCHGMAATSIAIHGRWESIKSLRHYLTNGRAIVQNMTLSPTHEQMITRYAQASRDFLHSNQGFLDTAPLPALPNSKEPSLAFKKNFDTHDPVHGEYRVGKDPPWTKIGRNAPPSDPIRPKSTTTTIPSAHFFPPCRLRRSYRQRDWSLVCKKSHGSKYPNRASFYPFKQRRLDAGRENKTPSSALVSRNSRPRNWGIVCR